MDTGVMAVGTDTAVIMAAIIAQAMVAVLVTVAMVADIIALAMVAALVTVARETVIFALAMAVVLAIAATWASFYARLKVAVPVVITRMLVGCFAQYLDIGSSEI